MIYIEVSMYIESTFDTNNYHNDSSQFQIFYATSFLKFIFSHFWHATVITIQLSIFIPIYM